ncbi:MAG: tRNA threonylcarbamoyladenosine biosynthesis protein TsaB [Planctomycetota bacterium]|jgi:tRNA threonylcarbamoyladenosine biosynthesis protein TsaB
MVQVALETSIRPARVALRLTEDRIVERSLDDSRAHASDLLPMLDGLLREHGASVRDIDAVIVGTGPGSYTGLRVGVATALGLLRGRACALFGIPSFEVQAFSALQVGEEADVLMDARGGVLYLASYRRLEQEVRVLRAPCVMKPADIAAALLEKGAILADDAALQAAGIHESLRSRVRTDSIASASALLALGVPRLAAQGSMQVEDVMPLYLRAFEAKPRRR